MRVDLPAPFSPTRARISPRATSSVTSDNAWTPGKALETPSTLSNTCSCAIACSLPKLTD